MRNALLFGLLFVLGCGQGLVEGEDYEDQDATDETAADEEDLALMPEDGAADFASTEDALADGTPQTVFVNFDGPVVTGCSDNCSDARRNRSWVMTALGHSRYDFAAYPKNGNRSIILSKLKAFYSRYNVRFVTSRPASGSYTMVVVSPSSTLPHHGVGPLDCGNRNRNDIVFVYKTSGASADLVAREAAHELGHSFGLTHVVSSADFMQWASSGRSFTKSSYDSGHPAGKCFSGSVQDAPALLKANLGLRPR